MYSVSVQMVDLVEEAQGWLMLEISMLTWEQEEVDRPFKTRARVPIWSQQVLAEEVDILAIILLR